jgi:hypothetical protein
MIVAKRWDRDAMDAKVSGAGNARTNDAEADDEVVWS